MAQGAEGRAEGGQALDECREAEVASASSRMNGGRRRRGRSQERSSGSQGASIGGVGLRGSLAVLYT